MDIKKHSTQDPIEFGDGRTTEDLAELKLDCTDRGIVQSLHNMATIMNGLKMWDGVFAYNELTEQIIVARPFLKVAAIPNCTSLVSYAMTMEAKFGCGSTDI